MMCGLREAWSVVRKKAAKVASDESGAELLRDLALSILALRPHIVQAPRPERNTSGEWHSQV